MNVEDINFPVYRKYKNNKSLFKIIAPDRFEQIQVIGSRYRVSQTVATIYPEKTYIRDLILDFQEMAVEISADEYEQLRAMAE